MTLGDAERCLRDRVSVPQIQSMPFLLVFTTAWRPGVLSGMRKAEEPSCSKKESKMNAIDVLRRLMKSI